MKKESRLDKYIAPSELPTFFRELADALEKGGEGDFACANDFKKIRIKIKDEFGKISLRVKFKSKATCEPTFDIAQDQPAAPLVKPEYKDLKKRMKSSFRMIFKMIHNDQIPPKDAVDSFLADSVLMVSYPGYGDDYYEAYTDACAEFAEAYKSGDLARLNETIDQIAFQKGHCHAKYD
ncbi:GAK system XXXCH domain-containing protein [uncultured Pseudodesulfovibrio sp.]|uniref:GAK system XXXCH domain-containing protein n=1 Tax=uncultured Pseudodesulfovibrio sp. TaxID=2035858 RepID=UPI0029C77D79|nr:GAK system XXXCH domain-containing protein [uncultured Pseudodesulfovibrio sp.]